MMHIFRLDCIKKRGTRVSGDNLGTMTIRYLFLASVGLTAYADGKNQTAIYIRAIYLLPSPHPDPILHRHWGREKQKMSWGQSPPASCDPCPPISERSWLEGAKLSAPTLWKFSKHPNYTNLFKLILGHGMVRFFMFLVLFFHLAILIFLDLPRTLILHFLQSWFPLMPLFHLVAFELTASVSDLKEE